MAFSKTAFSWFSVCVIFGLCVMMMAMPFKSSGGTSHRQQHPPFDTTNRPTYLYKYIMPSDVYLNSLWDRYEILADGEERRAVLKKFNHEISERVALQQQQPSETAILLPLRVYNTVRQCDADILYLWGRYLKLADGEERMSVLKEIHEEISRRARLETNMEKIAAFLFGPEAVSSVLRVESPTEDTWRSVIECLRSTIPLYKKRSGCGGVGDCGSFDGLIINICRNNVTHEKLEAALTAAGL